MNTLNPALPTVGRIVLVTLTADLANRINGLGCGNAAHAGETYPLIIARVWPPDVYPDGATINGQLILDGNASLWMTSVHHGDEPGQWHWPKLPQAAELSARTVKLHSERREVPTTESLAEAMHDAYVAHLSVPNSMSFTLWKGLVNDPNSLGECNAWRAAAAVAFEALV